ncbi:transmembrane emp24 domain-containing protein 5-like [Saccoglossus kowalevskii]
MCSIRVFYIYLTLVVPWALAQSHVKQEGAPIQSHSSRPYENIAFTVLIPARSEECFYQDIPAETSIMIEYEVLQYGLGRKTHVIDFTVMIYDEKLETIKQKPKGTFKAKTTEEGVLSLCFDNEFSVLSHKRLYLSLMIFKRGQWIKNIEMNREKLKIEKQKLGEMVTEMSSSTKSLAEKLYTIGENMDTSIMQQQYRRQIMKKDMFIVTSNMSYIQNWSIAQCVIIISASIVQAYFVRNLFNVKNVKPTQKTHA